MRIFFVLTLIAIIEFVATSMPCDAQYSGGNNRAYYNAGTYTGFGGRPSNQVSGFHSLGQTNQRAVANRPSKVQVHQRPSTMQNLEQALDAIDSPNAWSKTPVSVSVPATRSPHGNPYGGSVTAGRIPSAPGGMMPRVTRRDITRVMIEGGSLLDGGGGPTSYTSSDQASRASGTAYSSCQRAENAATRAHSAANRARYDREKWSKKDAADQAYYAANDAAAAADAAYAAASSGDSQARTYANQARGAANRARADADRARYNANTEY